MEFVRCRTGTVTAFGILTQVVLCPTVQAVRKQRHRCACCTPSITDLNRAAVHLAGTKPKTSYELCLSCTCRARTARTSSSRMCSVGSGTCLCTFYTRVGVRPLVATRLCPHMKFDTLGISSCPCGRSSPRTASHARTRCSSQPRARPSK